MKVKAIFSMNGERHVWMGRSPKKVFEAMMDFAEKDWMNVETFGMSFSVNGEHKWGAGCPGVGRHGVNFVPSRVEEFMDTICWARPRARKTVAADFKVMFEGGAEKWM